MRINSLVAFHGVSNIWIAVEICKCVFVLYIICILQTGSCTGMRLLVKIIL